MKFKTIALAALFCFATGVNAELATEANSINFRKMSGAEQNLADTKDAKFQNAHFKNADTAAHGVNSNSSQKATLIDEAKISTAWTSGYFAALSLMEATPQSCTSLASKAS